VNSKGPTSSASDSDMALIPDERNSGVTNRGELCEFNNLDNELSDLNISFCYTESDVQLYVYAASSSSNNVV